MHPASKIDVDSVNSSPFRTIPLEEIKKFLEYHEVPIISHDPKELYRQSWRYLLTHPNCNLVSPYLEDFSLAYHRLNNLNERWTASLILQGSDQQLSPLAESLGLPGVNRERIIRTLGYLNRLDHDMSVFDLLPLDILRVLGMRLDLPSLGIFSRISRRFHQLLGLTGELVELVRFKLHQRTGLDLTHYAKKELGLLLRRREPSRISAGQYHSLALTSQGQVYSFGDNEYGQLGLGDVEYINGPTILSISEITAISAGSVYSLFLTSQGQVYSCGLNEYYQLGLGDKKKRKIPTLIDNLTSSIVAISAGYGHSLFLDTQSQVFSCGNGRSGELGLGEIREARYPVLIEAPEIGRIIAISAGTNHSMILNSQGQVYGFGDNDYGQLGLGGVKERNIPTLIKMPDIIAISAGDGHSLFLTSKGLVIITGEALGLGEDRDNYYPFLIDMPNKIVAIAAGLHHSLFLDFQGLVFGLINNEDSELISDKEAPFLIKVPENHKIVDISVGQHSLLLEGDNIVVTPPDPADLNSQGQVYGFGDNDYGQLALEDSWVDNPTLIEGLVI